MVGVRREYSCGLGAFEGGSSVKRKDVNVCTQRAFSCVYIHRKSGPSTTRMLKTKTTIEGPKPDPIQSDSFNCVLGSSAKFSSLTCSANIGPTKNHGCKMELSPRKEQRRSYQLGGLNEAYGLKHGDYQGHQES